MVHQAVLLWVFGLHVALAAVLSFVPLFDVLGFERAFVTGLLTPVTSAYLGIHMLRSARALGNHGLWGVMGRSFGLSMCTILPTVFLGKLVELFGEPCHSESGVLFWVLLPGVGAFFGSALGVSGAAVIRRWWVSITAVALVFLSFLGAALVRLYTEPQIFVYSMPFGFWPGSIYDEALQVSSSLWAFRALTLGVSVLLVAVVNIFVVPETLRVAPRPRSKGSIAIAGSVLLVVVVLFVRGDSFGFALDRRSVERALSTHVRTEHFDIYLDASVKPEMVHQIRWDHEFRFWQLAKYFGEVPKHRLKSFVYKDRAQKARLMGASGTQIARPWVGEIHIHGFRYPHPVLKHELAHIFAGAFARGLFKVPTRFGVLVNMALVEGIAVAADWPSDELTVHGWACAMQALGLAPDLRKALHPFGFWSIASARAYTAAGSFVRYLVEQYGMDRLKQVYRINDFDKAYGASVSELVGEWESFLKGLALPNRDLLVAEHRFSRPSIFQKVCARSLANALRRGRKRVRTGHIQEGILDLEEAFRYRPQDPAPLLVIARALARAGRLDEARRYVERAADAPGATRKMRGKVREALADLDWREGALETARRGYGEVFELHLSSASDRTQFAKMAVLDQARTEGLSLRDYFLDPLQDKEALLLLKTLAKAKAKVEPSEASGLVYYLYGRRLLASGAYESAREMLTTALKLGVQDPLLPEARFLLGQSFLALKRPQEALAEFNGLAKGAPRQALRARALDWAERARFHQEFVSVQE